MGRTVPAGALFLTGGGEQPGLGRRGALGLGLGLGLGGRFPSFSSAFSWPDHSGRPRRRGRGLLLGRGGPGLRRQPFCPSCPSSCPGPPAMARLLVAGGDGLPGGEEPGGGVHKGLRVTAVLLLLLRGEEGVAQVSGAFGPVLGGGHSPAAGAGAISSRAERGLRSGRL